MKKMVGFKIFLVLLVAVSQIFLAVQSFAAIGATTVWTIRGDATASSVNGGGFNPNSTNLLTDLAGTSATGNTPSVSSASYTFVAGDVGAHVFIKSGTNWTPGWYEIASVAGGAATLKAAVGEASLVKGTVGSTVAPDVYINTVAGCATTASPTGGTFGVDYSQQTAAEFTPVDLAQTASSTTLTSATGGFTRSMVGNLIHITDGTNFTAGWYEIVSYTNTNTVVLDRTACSSDASSGTGRVGGAAAITEDTTSNDTFAAMVAGNGVWVKYIAGGYSTGEAISYTGGSTSAKSYLKGYSSVRGDTPSEAECPLIDVGAYGFELTGGYTAIKNISFIGSSATVVSLGTSSQFYRGKITNTSATADQYGVNVGTNSTLIASEIVCTNGRAVYMGTSPKVINNYIHDSNTGIIITANGGVVIGNIIDTMTTYGIYSNANRTDLVILGNTLYGANGGSSTAISLSSSQMLTLLSNIIADWNTGVTFSGYYAKEDYNLFYSNNSDGISGYGINDIVGSSPWSGDPAAGDFKVNTIAKAQGLGPFFGASSSANYVDMGAVQREEAAAGGGGGEVAYGF